MKFRVSQNRLKVYKKHQHTVGNTLNPKNLLDIWRVRSANQPRQWKFLHLPTIDRIKYQKEEPSAIKNHQTMIWGFPEMGVPLVITHLNGTFHYKPSLLG